MKAGTVITCVNCHEKVLKAVVDVQSGDEIKASQFVGIGVHPSPSEGELAECPNCGYPIRPSVEPMLQ